MLLRVNLTIGVLRKSSKQPFCDGSHRGSKFEPMSYKADQTKKVFFCTCKQTEDPPLCDGSHNKK